MKKFLFLLLLSASAAALCGCSGEPADYIVGREGTASRAVISYEEYSGIEVDDGNMKYQDQFVISDDFGSNNWHRVDTSSKAADPLVRTD